MSIQTVVGIDYSMTSPCICVYRTEKPFNFKNCDLFYYTKTASLTNQHYKNVHGELERKYTTEIERFLNISNWAIDILKGYPGIHVFLEGYSMGSKGKVFNIAENTAVLKVSLHLSGIPFSAVPPTTVKKFATGKGNADKAKMYESFYEETNVDLKNTMIPNRKEVTNPVTDIVDAFYLCKYGVTELATHS